MLPNTVRMFVVLGAVVCFAYGASAGESPESQATAKAILARFHGGNPSWKVRVHSLVQLARLGPEAIPVLTTALKNGSPSSREFAAQALGMILDSSARKVLTDAALNDKVAGVRNYACRALGMLGGVELSAKQKNDMRHHKYKVASLLRKEPPAEAKSLSKKLAQYDLGLLDSAQLGSVAPDFVLTDTHGKTYRLHQFRGEKPVLLEFNAAYS